MTALTDEGQQLLWLTHETPAKTSAASYTTAVSGTRGQIPASGVGRRGARAASVSLPNASG